MERWLARFSELFYCLMRIVAGALFACHGAQKVLGSFGGHADLSNPKLLVGGIIELLGGGLIAIGLQTGIAAFIASGEMAVAYLTVHAPHGFWPILNKGELAMLYCFVFLFMASRGSGALSVDGVLGKKGRP
jgi:putative oxidoreductase